MKFFIPTRDRFTTLEKLLAWLKANGQDPGETYLVDMNSTFEPMCDRLTQWHREGYRVLLTGKNLGARGMFKAGIIKARQPRGAFFMSDPDVVPADTCKPDLLERMHRFLGRHPAFTKAGLALRIDDLPEHFPFREQVQKWEARFWAGQEIGKSGFRPASLATTFCCVRDVHHVTKWAYSSGRDARSMPPDLGIHEPWYLDPDNMPEDELYYYDHAPRRDPGNPGAGTSWSLGSVRRGWIA